MKKQKSKESEFEEEKEESDLEEEIEDSKENIEIRDDISDREFIEFLNPSENTAPSLEQVEIATELRATDLEQGVSNISGLEDNKKKEEDPFKYKVSLDLNEEPKYISSGNEIERVNLPSNVDMMTLGKEESFLPRSIGFSASPVTQIGESDNMGKYTIPDKVDINKIGKGNIFEKKELKYTPSEEY